MIHIWISPGRRMVSTIKKCDLPIKQVDFTKNADLASGNGGWLNHETCRNMTILNETPSRIGGFDHEKLGCVTMNACDLIIKTWERKLSRVMVSQAAKSATTGPCWLHTFCPSNET